MIDLRNLTEALLERPPHPAPALDELQRRVDRRRRRRARAIGATSILAVALVAAVLLAVPRVSELQVGDAPPTTGGASAEPEPMAVTDVKLTVNPESAPLTADRTLLFTNTSDQPYTECGMPYELRRWDGNGWVPVGIYHTMTAPPFLQDLDAPFTDGRCVAPYTVEPGRDIVTYFNPGTTVRAVGSGTIPADQEPLEPGRYELASVAGSPSPLTAVGRFEITAEGAATTGGTAPTDPSAQPANPSLATTAPPATQDPLAVTTQSLVDVWPGDPLTPEGTVQPDRIVVVDDDTVALTWNGACNQPADVVDVRTTDSEVELWLHVGSFPVQDCFGAPERWVLTFDLDAGIGDRRLVVRHDRDGTGGSALAVDAADHPDDADPPGLYVPAGPKTPVSFHLIEDTPGSYRTSLPSPLAPTTLWCEQQSYDVGELVVIRVREQASPNPGATNGCGAPYFYATSAGRTMFGAS